MNIVPKNKRMHLTATEWAKMALATAAERKKMATAQCHILQSNLQPKGMTTELHKT
jgi:hypothetical protein